MKNVFIASFDMEVGGVERSLVHLLEHFDYRRYAVDLLLYRRSGDFLPLLPKEANLLEEVRQLATFRKSIKETFREGRFGLGLVRLFAKARADALGRRKALAEPGYYQLQLMWKYALPLLPRIEREYDAAISYLWPHEFVGAKVRAKRKIAWIHTDYSTVETDVALDLAMWGRFDAIVAVSDACRESFLRKYPELERKVAVVENLHSPAFIERMSREPLERPMAGDDRFKVVTVARLSHAKGIDNAVRALRILKDRGYDKIAWYVVGYGGDEDAIRRLIAECGLERDFVLLGKRTNPYPFMRGADLYVQPSRYEGKAVTVTEAQILGKPVLITNYATAPSQVRDRFDGLIAELSAEGIADGVERLYLDEGLRRTLSDNCRSVDYGNRGELEKLYRLLEI